MRFLQRTLASAAVMALACAGGAAASGFDGNGSTMFEPASRSYSGAWPVTVSRSQRSNGTYCLTLTQNGSDGGSASLVVSGKKYPYGSFLVVDGILMATIIEPLYGQNGALTFVAAAKRGNIGRGLFENIEGGSNFDAGALSFGAKGGC